MNNVKCPVCGSENKNTNIACEKCGNKLIDEEQIQKLINEEQIQKVYSNITADISQKYFSLITTGAAQAVAGIAISALLIYFEFNSGNRQTRMILIPFIILGVLATAYGISQVVEGKNIKKRLNDLSIDNLDVKKIEQNDKETTGISTIFFKLYLGVFLLFLFGTLLITDISAIKEWSDGGDSTFFCTIIFWAAGIYVVIKEFKKK